MKIDFFDIFKSTENKRKFIILLKLDLPRNIKLSFKDDKIYIRVLENVKNPNQTRDEFSEIIENCFDKCELGFIEVRGSFYISENNEYVYVGDLGTNTPAILNRIKYKLDYDEISLKDLYHLL